jgi:hypothetical protein
MYSIDHFLYDFKHLNNLLICVNKLVTAVN